MQKHSYFLRYFVTALFTTLLIFAISASFYFVEQNTKQNGFFTSSDIIVYRKYNDIIQVGFMGFNTKIDTLETKTKLEEFSSKTNIFLPPEIKMLRFSADLFDYLSYSFLNSSRNFLYSLSISDES